MKFKSLACLTLVLLAQQTHTGNLKVNSQASRLGEKDKEPSLILNSDMIDEARNQGSPLAKEALKNRRPGPARIEVKEDKEEN